MDESKRQRRFHFKDIRPKDPEVRRFGEWSQANLGFYNSFRQWLKDTGYSDSSLHLYSVAARYAIGYLDKPYWVIDSGVDMERVRERLQGRQLKAETKNSYQAGLDKFDEFLRLRCHRPLRQKVINWTHYIGCLPQWLAQDVKDFIAHNQRRWTPQRRCESTQDTLGHLTSCLRWMTTRYPLENITEITPEVWFAYLDERLLQGIKPTTINSELSMLRRLLFFLEERGRSICTRTLLVDYLNKGHGLPKDVSPGQLQILQQEILREAASSNGLNRRMGILDRAWFFLMLHSGLRSCEVRTLRLADIDWEGRRVRIEDSKGLKDRIVYLSHVTVEAIQSYVKVRGPAEALPDQLFIFRHKPLCKTYCYTRLRTYSKRCGLHVTPHQLRHSCATLLLNAGAPILTVKMLLGHQYVDTTLGYARLYDGTIAADYYHAMAFIEKSMSLPEDQTTSSPNPGELIALLDSLRDSTLSTDQQELVWQLRSGILALVYKEALQETEVEV